MGSFPWKAEQMTWVHHSFFGACESIIAEKQSGRSTGKTIRNVMGDTSRYDRLEKAFRAKARARG